MIQYHCCRQFPINQKNATCTCTLLVPLPFHFGVKSLLVVAKIIISCCYKRCAMDPDGFSEDPPSATGFSKDPPSGDSSNDDAPPWHHQPSTANQYRYTPTDLAILQSIETEAASLFPFGKQYESPDDLRKDVRNFAYQKGFEITSDGWTFRCSRCAEPQSLL